MWLRIAFKEPFASSGRPRSLPPGAPGSRAGDGRGSHPAAPAAHPKGRPAAGQGEQGRALSSQNPTPKAENVCGGNSKYFNRCKLPAESISWEVVSLFLEQNIVLSCFGNAWASGKEQKLVGEHEAKENQDKYETT